VTPAPPPTSSSSGIQSISQSIKSIGGPLHSPELENPETVNPEPPKPFDPPHAQNHSPQSSYANNNET